MQTEGISEAIQRPILQWQGLGNARDALHLDTYARTDSDASKLSIVCNETTAIYIPQIMQELQYHADESLHTSSINHVKRLRHDIGEAYQLTTDARHSDIQAFTPDVHYDAETNRITFKMDYVREDSPYSNPLADLPDREVGGFMLDVLAEHSPTLYALAARPEHVRSTLHELIDNKTALQPILEHSQFTPKAMRNPLPDIEVTSSMSKAAEDYQTPDTQFDIKLELPYSVTPSDISNSIINHAREHSIPHTSIFEHIPPVRMQQPEAIMAAL